MQEKSINEVALLPDRRGKLSAAEILRIDANVCPRQFLRVMNLSCSEAFWTEAPDDESPGADPAHAHELAGSAIDEQISPPERISRRKLLAGAIATAAEHLIPSSSVLDGGC